jgi:hypothetical protein
MQSHGSPEQRLVGDVDGRGGDGGSNVGRRGVVVAEGSFGASTRCSHNAQDVEVYEHKFIFWPAVSKTLVHGFRICTHNLLGGPAHLPH